MKDNLKKLISPKNIVLAVAALAMLVAAILMFTIKAQVSIGITEPNGDYSYVGRYEQAVASFGQCFKGGVIKLSGTMTQRKGGIDIGSLPIEREFVFQKGNLVTEYVIFIVLAFVSVIALVGSIFIPEKHLKLRKLVRVFALVAMGAVVIETMWVSKGSELIDFKTPIRADIIEKGGDLKVLNDYSFKHENACSAGVVALISFVIAFVGSIMKYPEAKAE